MYEWFISNTELWRFCYTTVIFTRSLLIPPSSFVLILYRLKVRKTQEGGLNCVYFFFNFSPTEVTDQKQIEFSFWSYIHNLNAEDKYRERRKTQSNYTGSFHKPEVVMSPLHFQGEFTKNVISNYNCSMLQLARDFKLLKHNCKRFPMLLNKVKRLPMLKRNCKKLLMLKHTSKRLLI